MSHGWEGNRRFGVALAMRHKLSGLSTYGSTAIGREMSTPPTPLVRHGTPYPLRRLESTIYIIGVRSAATEVLGGLVANNYNAFLALERLSWR